MNEIQINLGPYFTFNFKIFGFILIIFSVLVPMYAEVGAIIYLISPLMIAVGLGLITARRKAILNLDAKYFFDYVTMLGIKNGNRTTFDTIDLIFINKIHTSSNFQTRGRSLQIEGVIFKAFMLFSNGEKARLDEDKNKDKLMERILIYNQTINSQIRDNT